MDAKKRLKKGDAILMINPGGGFKLNSCVLEVVRDLNDDNVWKDCIARYPPENTVNRYKERYAWIADADPQTFKILLEKARDLNDDGGTEGLHC
ncbi:3-ketoacyl-CoA synthase [Thalictrum thalictroides]|uniref:3-ketoacyl-CoA synthase n=1 Tax=Thalictrum thalictroides TaxID=46969 RepID=A0A7J6V4J0_THATH|nr:3-ketoacyl-CoA synthase [Thalictrum thalictroides]